MEMTTSNTPLGKHATQAATGQIAFLTSHLPPFSPRRLMFLKRPPPISFGMGSIVFMSYCSESNIHRQSWVQYLAVAPKAFLILFMSPIWQSSEQSSLHVGLMSSKHLSLNSFAPSSIFLSCTPLISPCTLSCTSCPSFPRPPC